MAPETIDNLLHVVRWSMTCLWNGFWPEADHNGAPFTSGYRARNARKPLDPSHRRHGAFAQMRGDKKYCGKYIVGQLIIRTDAATAAHV